jgi:hypothetical protein
MKYGEDIKLFSRAGKCTRRQFFVFSGVKTIETISQNSSDCPLSEDEQEIITQTQKKNTKQESLIKKEYEQRMALNNWNATFKSISRDKREEAFRTEAFTQEIGKYFVNHASMEFVRSFRITQKIKSPKRQIKRQKICSRYNRIRENKKKKLKSRNKLKSLKKSNFSGIGWDSPTIKASLSNKMISGGPCDRNQLKISSVENERFHSNFEMNWKVPSINMAKIRGRDTAKYFLPKRYWQADYYKSSGCFDLTNQSMNSSIHKAGQSFDWYSDRTNIGSIYKQHKIPEIHDYHNLLKGFEVTKKKPLKCFVEFDKQLSRDRPKVKQKIRKVMTLRGMLPKIT